jgi:hypothetical protein
MRRDRGPECTTRWLLRTPRAAVGCAPAMVEQPRTPQQDGTWIAPGDGPSPDQPAPEARSFAWARSWKTWAALIVPVVALAELVAHVVQVRTAVPGEAWDQAREVARTMLQPADGLLFSPRWTEPLGRMHFGDQLATLDRMAPPDYTRFPRVLEVSIRGRHRPEVAGWTLTEERRVGPVRLRMLANPSPVQIVDNLIDHVRPHDLSVVEASLADGSERPCPFTQTGPRSGPLGFGPAIPADKFTCSRGGPVAVTVVTDLDYYPHRCIYAPPPGSGATLRLRFASIRFGKLLHGHHGLYVEAERLRQGAPIEISFRVGDKTIGTVAHQDGEGWSRFQFDTSDLQGSTDELTIEIRSTFAERRMYCFEADTR